MNSITTTDQPAKCGEQTAQTVNRTRTELLCLAFGWQGGTVHQVAEKTGLSVKQIIDGSPYNDANGDETSGATAFRTCPMEYRERVLYPKEQGNLHFWCGIARGVELSLRLGDYAQRLNA